MRVLPIGKPIGDCTLRNLRKIVARNIAKYREANGWSAYKLAQLLGITPSAVSRWESCDNEPDFESLLQMAELFGIDPKDLLDHGTAKVRAAAHREPTVGEALRVIKRALSKVEAPMTDNKQVQERLPVILWVDDETFVREAISDKLRAKGYTVHECDNGKEGLQMLRQYKFDIVISDNQMPELSGLAMMAEINTKYPHIIKIMATSSPITSEVISDLHIDAYIEKPFKSNGLVLQEVERLWALRVETVKNY
jgi:CheY-like chemotaxis protein